MSPAVKNSGTGVESATSVEQATWALEALRTVWEHQHGRIQRRLQTIECAIAALADDCVDPELSREAVRAAHMLAGSLGMFGFGDAAGNARELERRLPDAEPSQVPLLSALLRGARVDVQGDIAGAPLRGPVVTTSHISAGKGGHEISAFPHASRTVNRWPA